MKNTTASRIPSLVLFALFIIVLLIALVAGVRAYSSIVNEGDNADEQRFANGLIINSVRAMDSYASIQEGQGPQGKSIVLLENTDAGFFETRIYLWQGEVILEFASSYEPYQPSRGTKLMVSQTFDIVLEPGILHVTTDEGTTDIAIRSNGSGVR